MMQEDKWYKKALIYLIIVIFSPLILIGLIIFGITTLFQAPTLKKEYKKSRYYSDIKRKFNLSITNSPEYRFYNSAVKRDLPIVYRRQDSNGLEYFVYNGTLFLFPDFYDMDLDEDTGKWRVAWHDERADFSERFKNIIDQYNAGGSENEDYYEQLLQLIEDMKNEDKRAETEGLTEEELEMFDLLIKGRKLTKDEEQKVKLAAKNLYKKLTEEKQNLFVVDWYKDEQTANTVKDAISSSLDADLPQSFDKEAFDSKINLLLNHFVDMSVQHYGWLGEVA